jgi:hypothetical protein
MPTLRALRFLFVGPLVLLLLVVVNLVTSPGHWWVQWAALGIGIAWLVSLFRVLKGALLVGGLVALVALLRKGGEGAAAGPGGPGASPGTGAPPGGSPGPSGGAPRGPGSGSP